MRVLQHQEVLPGARRGEDPGVHRELRVCEEGSYLRALLRNVRKEQFVLVYETYQIKRLS